MFINSVAAIQHFADAGGADVARYIVGKDNPDNMIWMDIFDIAKYAKFGNITQTAEQMFCVWAAMSAVTLLLHRSWRMDRMRGLH